VRSVESGSPAEKAGVEAGDIIVRFDGKTIDKASDLPRLVGNTKPGTRSTFTVFRRGQNRDLSITIAELEPIRWRLPAASRPRAAASRPRPPARCRPWA
jgi:serine protease Do